jgi:RNA polymerase sigma-70 factor (ECF subfamily)
VITEIDSNRTLNELPGSVKCVAPASTDEVLVVAARSGDHPAFVELWTRYSSRVFKTKFRITGNREDAEDAIQDAWMKAYLHLNTFERQGTIQDLAHAHCDQFVANDSSEEICSS